MQKNKSAVALGKLGGSKGGHICATVLSAEQRSSIASKAALIRHRRDREIKKVARSKIVNEIVQLQAEKRGCPRFSSQWHRTDSAIQALLWVKQTVLR